MRELDVQIWQLRFSVCDTDVEIYSHVLTEFGASVAFDHDRAGDTVQLDVTFPTPRDEEGEPLIKTFFDNFSLPFPPVFTLEKLEDRDWLADNRKSFPPLTIGSFFIYGSHYDGVMPEGKIPLLLDAATAFGSGEHATTRGCLLALEKIIQDRSPSSVLDMGCGSGILCLAAAKLLQVPMIASDMDPDSVSMSQLNMLNNGISGVDVRLGDGYDALGSGEIFDLILSNILAQPLITMAPSLVRALNPGGKAILSGFLDDQADDVIAAHIQEGLTFVSSASYDGWVTAVLEK